MKSEIGGPSWKRCAEATNISGAPAPVYTSGHFWESFWVSKTTFCGYGEIKSNGNDSKKNYDLGLAYLIFVTTITATGCGQKLAKRKIFQLKRQKMLCTQCHLLHTILSQIYPFSNVHSSGPSFLEAYMFSSSEIGAYWMGWEVA